MDEHTCVLSSKVKFFSRTSGAELHVIALNTVIAKFCFLVYLCACVHPYTVFSGVHPVEKGHVRIEHRKGTAITIRRHGLQYVVRSSCKVS